MNNELAELFAADRKAHDQVSDYGTPAYLEMRKRDGERRQRVREIVAAGGTSVAEDYYHAAWILNHGDQPDDAWQGHTLALKAAAEDFGPAKWLAAATYDRWRMYLGKPQKYGTQFVSDGKRHRLWDVDDSTTDEERAEWNVPPLREQLRKAAEETERAPPAPIDDSAPQWLKDAIERWSG